jgi:hypothetical protein
VASHHSPFDIEVGISMLIWIVFMSRTKSRTFRTKSRNEQTSASLMSFLSSSVNEFHECSSQAMHGRSKSRRRPRGDGTRGPRSSCAGLPRASSSRVTLNVSTQHLDSSACSFTVATLLCLAIVLGLAVVIGAALPLTAVVASFGSNTSAFQSYNATSLNVANGWPPRILHGGEAFESIQFMETAPVLEAEAFSEATERWLADLQHEKKKIEGLPFVKDVSFIVKENGTANENRVQATVWCCWDNARRSFKQVQETLTDKPELGRPTHLEALRSLHGKLLDKHGQAGHVPDHRALERKAEIQAAHGCDVQMEEPSLW